MARHWRSSFACYITLIAATLFQMIQAQKLLIFNVDTGSARTDRARRYVPRPNLAGSSFMDLVKRISYLGIAMAISGLLAGCFSYHREVVTEPSTPAAESAPTSSTTTTTTTNDDGTVQRRSTTTYSSTP